MIPKDFITEWRNFVPWAMDAQVEQDLIVCRALIDIYRHSELSERFAFRGGTALSKLYLPQAMRYSEDIDLVQIKREPIGKALDSLRSVFESWLGSARVKQKKGSVNLTYRFVSEGPPTIPLRLRIEINSREHFSVFGLVKRHFKIQSRWCQGNVEIFTYSLDELLATKLRALYQRRKGRDLFDLWASLTFCKANAVQIIKAFEAYLKNQKVRISQKEFLENLDKKLASKDFLRDTETLIIKSVKYNPQMAAQVIKEQLLSRLA